MKRLLLGVWFSAIITLTILGDPHSAVAAPGDLDPTFGNGGVATDYVGRKVTVHKVLTQADGKILVVGTWKVQIQLNHPPEDRVFIRRYTAAGALDQTFGLGRPGIGFDAALQSDGKIVVLGRAPNTISSYFGTIDTISPVVWRYNSNGTIDTGFGSNGARFIGQVDGPASKGNYHLGIFNDQIFVGYAAKSPFIYGATIRYKVSRISATGTVDFTVTPPFKYFSNEKVFAMKVDPVSGNIVAVGPKDSTENSIVRRYTQAGVVDSGFGSNGEAAVPDCGTTELRPKDLVIQMDGNILVHRYSGYNYSSVDISRMLPDGVEDNNFQCFAGYLPPAIGDTLYLQPDGRFFFYVGLFGGAIRRLPDGLPDANFNGVTYFPSAIQADQKIVEAHAVYPDYTSISISRRLLD